MPFYEFGLKPIRRLSDKTGTACCRLFTEISGTYLTDQTILEVSICDVLAHERIDLGLELAEAREKIVAAAFGSQTKVTANQKAL
jgi:hypothetical protein